ncbi:MAG: FHA domain-containing protein [Hormoscilla sp.]
MLADPVQIKLSWKDPITGELQEPVLEVPIAFGRELNEMPASLGDKTVQRVVLNSKKVSRFHALITCDHQQLSIADRSANGTFVQKQQLYQTRMPLNDRDTIRLGPYKITITLMSDYDPEDTEVNTSLTTSSLASVSAFWQQPWVTVTMGTILVLLMGAGAWVLASNLLEKYGPQAPQTPSPTSQNHPIRKI